MLDAIRMFLEGMLGMMFAKLFLWGLLALPILALAGAFGLLGRRRATGPPGDGDPPQDDGEVR